MTLTFFPDGMKLLGHFQADESRADDGDMIHCRGCGFDPVQVMQILQRVDERAVDPGQGWTQRAGTGGEDEIVVIRRVSGLAFMGVSKFGTG